MRWMLLQVGELEDLDDTNAGTPFCRKEWRCMNRSEVAAFRKPSYHRQDAPELVLDLVKPAITTGRLEFDEAVRQRWLRPAMP